MSSDSEILHLLVIGFHHKKGYQVPCFVYRFFSVHAKNEAILKLNVLFSHLHFANKTFAHMHAIAYTHTDGWQVDYSYPPLTTDKDGATNECPDGWKFLPTLALPDGSHNFIEDTVFFNLPSLKDPKKTIYGISCYRQIDSEVCGVLEFFLEFFRIFQNISTTDKLCPLSFYFRSPFFWFFSFLCSLIDFLGMFSITSNWKIRPQTLRGVQFRRQFAL